jgi:hypothetical protein
MSFLIDRFPFLFYASVPSNMHFLLLLITQFRTSYMGQVMAYEENKEPDPEYATRTGELAMLIYSIGWCFKLMFI